MTARKPPRDRALELVEQLEDNVGYDEILYRLYLLQQIEEGLEDAEEGRTTSHDEIGEKIDKWLE